MSSNLVSINELEIKKENSNKSFSPGLLNWVEPYLISGVNKTLFYTEVDSNLKIGDRVFIVNGLYDSNTLISENKYKTGRDGYKVLKVDKCKIVLDIDYTGDKPYKIGNIDDFIKIYFIRNKSEFISANRNVTTRGGQFNNKFSYYQNNIIYVDSNYTVVQNWGINNGVSGSPGFFVRDYNKNWTNISNDVLSGGYSYSLSPTYTNNDRIKILNGDFSYGGIDFKDGFIYKWENNKWVVDIEYLKPFIGKSNFRSGIFNGTWNGGIYGQQSSKIDWIGTKSTWNIGTILNTNWLKGKINSLYTSEESYYSGIDSYNLPYQKLNSYNNSGHGYNFIIDSYIKSSTIENANIINSSFSTQSYSYSSVENEIKSTSYTASVNIEKSYIVDCYINNSIVNNSELINIRAYNSLFKSSKSANSYFYNSVFKNSSYNSDSIIKIYAYDEFIASEYPTLSSTFSYINDSVQKVYKFYIDEDGFNKIKSSDSFYIKGLKIKDNSKNILNFFDKKFKIRSWTEYVDDDNYSYKIGYECSSFLSTPEENSYKFTSVTTNYISHFYTTIFDDNNNKKYYSIDIWVSRYDLNGILSEVNFNRGSTASIYTSPIEPKNLGNIVDVSEAYIVNSDFDSGIFEKSDWNSGYNIERNNDLNITIPGLTGGRYNLSISSSDLYITATTSFNSVYSESELLEVGSVVFMDSVDFNNGSVNRLSDAYKIISNTNGVYKLSEIIYASASVVLGLSASSGYFYTDLIENRYGHLKSLKINKSNLKSGIFKRSLINSSLIQNSDIDVYDKDFTNITKCRSLVISDSIFSNKQNTLSSAIYLYSFFTNGNDIWNTGIINSSIINGITFSNGSIIDTRWVDGNFLGGIFYNSRSFNSNSSVSSPFYYSENKNSYYKSGILPNNRNSWQKGKFTGDFSKGDWESGTFVSGKFYNSKWYNGIFENGTIGNNKLAVSDTIFYNGTISYAIVDNATLYSYDTSFSQGITQSITWLNGVFNDGLFGSYMNNSATWENGIFNGGQFISSGKWKNGIFNNGKFISGYGWTNSSSSIQSDYTWENGVFNGGEFGLASGYTNSTWYTGEFNDGYFKGRVWNNGIFLYGEFSGSGTNPVAGVTCANANIFVDSFTNSYWGLWRDGFVSNIKDKFIKDQKVFTSPVKFITLERLNIKKSAKLKNILWMSGTFSHSNGEINNSVWLDGKFERGKFNSSSFNPYVKRNGSPSQSFNLSDSCYWENGELENSEFFISKWENGKFIMGTATGMIWKNGIVNYMNAFNVFWEDGIWRNGNWYGSSFEFNGQIESDYVRQIVNRGMSWSGTSSNHIWNIFLQSSDTELSIVSATAYDPTGLSGLVSSASSYSALPPPLSI